MDRHMSTRYTGNETDVNIFETVNLEDYESGMAMGGPQIHAGQNDETTTEIRRVTDDTTIMRITDDTIAPTNSLPDDSIIRKLDDEFEMDDRPGRPA